MLAEQVLLALLMLWDAFRLTTEALGSRRLRLGVVGAGGFFLGWAGALSFVCPSITFKEIFALNYVIFFARRLQVTGPDAHE